MVIFDRCGHVPMEECPRAFLGEVLPFLREHRRPWRERWMETARGALVGVRERIERLRAAREIPAWTAKSIGKRARASPRAAPTGGMP
jgi:hypothetical protein